MYSYHDITEAMFSVLYEMSSQESAVYSPMTPGTESR